MKGIVVVQEGIEEVAQAEVLELLPHAKVETHPTYLLVETKTIQDLIILAYRMQSMSKVMLLLGHGKDPKEAVEHADLSRLQNKTFATRSIIHNTLDSSMELEHETGGMIKTKSQSTVSLSKPDITTVVMATKQGYYIGLDLCVIESQKREYRIFRGMEFLRATTCYAAIKFAGYKPGQTIIDPFARSGTVPIEAALYATKTSPLYFTKDTLAASKLEEADDVFAKQDALQEEAENIYCLESQNKHLSSAKKNAKIAGITKAITFSRMDLDWLETRFEEDTVDHIVTAHPERSRTFTEKKIQKLLKELMYQASYILKEDGTLTLITKEVPLVLEAAQKENFQEDARMQAAQGHEVYTILRLKQA